MGQGFVEGRKTLRILLMGVGFKASFKSEGLKISAEQLRQIIALRLAVEICNEYFAATKQPSEEMLSRFRFRSWSLTFAL